MAINSSQMRSPKLIWIYPEDIKQRLNAAPRLEVAKELRLLGWDADLIAIGEEGIQTISGVEIRTFSIPGRYFFGNIVFHYKVVKYILSNWPAINVILFYKSSVLWMLLLWIKRLFSRRKLPLFVMDTRTVNMMPLLKSSIKDVIRESFHEITGLLANAFVDGQTAITQRMAEAVHIPQRQLLGVWPSGVNLQLFAQSKEKRCWPEGEDPVSIIYVGALSTGRNLPELCKAVELANQHGMKFTLSFFGRGDCQPELEAHTLISDGHITVSNPVPHHQVPDLLNRANVGVLPFPDEPKFQVSSPIKLFEYMGSGMPVLATQIACHTDVIGNGSFVFWAKDASIDGLYQALCKVWEEKEQLPLMGSRASAASQNWTYRSSAEKLKRAFEKCMIQKGLPITFVETGK